MQDIELYSFFGMVLGGMGGLYWKLFSLNGCLQGLASSFKTFLKFHGYRVDGVPNDGPPDLEE